MVGSLAHDSIATHLSGLGCVGLWEDWLTLVFAGASSAFKAIQSIGIMQLRAAQVGRCQQWMEWMLKSPPRNTCGHLRSCRSILLAIQALPQHSNNSSTSVTYSFGLNIR